MGGKWICANFSPQLHQHLWAKLQHHTEIKWSHGILLLHRENHWLENLNVCFWEKWKCRRVPSARAFPLSTSRNDVVARGWGVGRKMKWQLFKALGLSELYCGKTVEQFCVTHGTLFSRAFWEDSSHIARRPGVNLLKVWPMQGTLWCHVPTHWAHSPAAAEETHQNVLDDHEEWGEHGRRRNKAERWPACFLKAQAHKCRSSVQSEAWGAAVSAGLGSGYLVSSPCSALAVRSPTDLLAV